MRIGIISLVTLCFACAEDPDRVSGALGETNIELLELRAAMTRYSACGADDLDSFVETALLAPNLRDAAAAELNRVVNCLNGADDCDAVLACTGRRIADCNRGDEFCDGSVRYACIQRNGRTFELRRDCADGAHGNTECRSADGGYSECTSSIRCDGEISTRCDGNVRVSCFGGYATLTDCALAGQICAENGATARCIVREAAECDTCVGDVWQDCGDGAIRQTFDCSIMGLACNADDPDVPCTTVEPECEDGMGRCVGDTAEQCFGGQWFDFDCGAYGAGCALLINGDATCEPVQ